MKAEENFGFILLVKLSFGEKNLSEISDSCPKNFELSSHPNQPVRLLKTAVFINSMLSSHTSIYDLSYAIDNIKKLKRTLGSFY